jgi:hypothetical protein
MYTVKLTVQHKSSLKYGYAEIDVAVIQGDIVAQVVGQQPDSTVGIHTDASFTFDASTTYDADLPTLNARNISTVFTCRQTYPTYHEACDLDMVVSQYSLTVSVPGSSVSYINNKYSIRLDAVHEVDFRSDSLMMTLEIFPSSSAIIAIESDYPTKLNPADKVKVIATVKFSVGGSAVWSVDDPDIDLASVALNPYNSTLFARSTTSLTEISLSLVLPRNTLPQSSTYQFMLTVHLVNGYTTTSAFSL